MAGRNESQQRLPLEPLMAYLGVEFGWGNGTKAGWAATIAELTGCDRSTVMRWAKEGGIPEPRADVAAIAAGSHPAIIWPDWYRDITRDVAA